MMPGFLMEEGEGYGKIGNFSDITYFGLETGDGFVYINDVYIFIISFVVKSFL